MLLQLRDYVRREQIVSNQQIARELHIDVQTLQPLLDIWVSKGVLRRYKAKANCHSQAHCASCLTNPPIYYEYVST